MGTKLQYAITPLASTQNTNSFSQLRRLDDSDYLRKKGLNDTKTTVLINFEDSMDRRMPEQQQQNIESIKKTMLMHEDIFKQQVRELHRLYSVQKMQMDEMRNGMKPSNLYWLPMTTASDTNYSSNLFNRHQPITTTSTTTEYKIHVRSPTDNPSQERERSGSCSGEALRIMAKGGFDLERPAIEEEADISTGISAIDEDQAAGPSTYRARKINNTIAAKDGYDHESDVELRLSIGGGGCMKKTMSHDHDPRSPELDCHGLTDHDKFRELGVGSSSLIKSERGGGGGGGGECSGSNSTSMGSSSSAALDQQSKRPHWLFQGLSLNRT